VPGTLPRRMPPFRNPAKGKRTDRTAAGKRTE